MIDLNKSTQAPNRIPACHRYLKHHWIDSRIRKADSKILYRVPLITCQLEGCSRSGWSLEGGESHISTRKDTSTLPKTHMEISNTIPQRDLVLFDKIAVHCKPRWWADILKNTVSWLCADTDSRRHRTSSWPSSQSRVLWRSYDHRIINHLSHSPCGGSTDLSYGYFLSTRMHNWNRVDDQLAQLSQSLPKLWNKDYSVMASNWNCST